ncbi:hypothetical protein E1A91_A12G202100v1 [Gossypium mustelinum]|uniref:Autophagy-related protein 16 domain-containing protein n=1 Tax=Gossypium mustelinum TaxID=34275 RepID=A0A5D2WY86_GOSMU|nr:hypothetical protein E1A91_A12G202100v1 [Gossypium mustelinum]
MFNLIFRWQEEVAKQAIKHALKALKKRHLVEEGAHSPAYIALSRPIISQGSEWKGKAEKLEVELQQCYKAQSRLSEQLVVEVAESRTLKAFLQEKETAMAELEKELTQTRDEYSQLKTDFEEKVRALELLLSEYKELKAQLEQLTIRATNAEAENKRLDAELLNVANALYEDMTERLKASGLEKLAQEQVDGIVRRSEEGAEFFAESTVPSVCKDRINAHDGHSLFGCLGSVLDLAITHDNRSIIAGSSSNNLFVWDVNLGHVHHTLTSHTEKVCAVDVSKVSSRHVVSSAYGRTIKVWDLQKGYCTNTIIFHSNCNALCFSTDGLTICSGHVDGNLRLWDIQTGKLLSEVSAHSLAIISLSLSVAKRKFFGTFRATGNKVASNWSRSFISPDDNNIAAGSAHGSIYIWSISKADMVSTLKEHTAPILCCTWSAIGKPLAYADKNGVVCTWT